ncbi:putative F-box/LRR-repeat protein At3g28410 [Panicum hallii]|uniref:putative F-box/LRR-repeat protein At3g28410 n=1 Tax=Panicum hallii TaxID=206008 RepID=UPI000DF4E1A8|nr:putative F-box/LRR-repeat protein At3g28410 [Panicum hallii]
MAAEAGDDGLRRLPPGPGPGPDRISALPDELIQAILAWLPSTAAAARTSAVSRRWRHVWTGVPALSFHVEQKPLREYSSTDAALDAALDAYSDSAALSRLTIDVDGPSPAPRIAPWLRFASLRLAGELRLTLKGGAPKQPVMMGPLVHHPIAMGPFVHQPVLLAIGDLMQQLELPACERATRIDLAGINFALRLPPAGAFAALRILRISVTDLVRGDVGHLVSTQCPRLRDLELCGVTLEAANLSISSASLERLVLRRVSIKNEGRIDVAAPSMYYLALDNCGGRSVAVTIATAMLAELIWNHAYDPRLHKLEGADRQIYRLVATYGSNAALFRRFDAVDELCLRLSMLSDQLAVNEPRIEWHKCFFVNLFVLG